MKRFTLFLFMVFLFTNCVQRIDPVDPNKGHEEVIANMTTTVVYSVPVREGYTTYVTYKGQLLAITSRSIDINIPKEAVSTKGDGDLTVYYKLGTTEITKTYLWQTICFEDSKTGDFDYNDLIIHTLYQTEDATLTVKVHPIALGAAKDSKLGFIWHNGSHSGSVIVAEDCREELFGGMEGFINTNIYNKHFDDFVAEKSVTLPDPSSSVEINWFIVVDGNNTIYAINQYGYHCVDDDGMPFAFAITEGGLGEVNASSAPYAFTKAAEYSSWSQITALWSFPAEPQVAVYGSLPDMSTYQTWGSAASADYYVRAGQQYTGAIVKNGNSFYIKGKVTLNAAGWGPSIANLYILEGGELVVSVSSLQYYHIYNYGGTLTYTNDIVNFSNGMLYMTTGDLEAASLVLEKDSKAFIGNKINVSTLRMINTSELYYGCCLYATESVYLTNSAILYVKHFLQTPSLTMTTSSAMYLNADEDQGCWVDIQDMYHSTNDATAIYAVGSSDYAVFNVNHYLLDGYSHGADQPFDVSDRFIGNIDLHYQMANNSDSWDTPNPSIQLTVSDDVIINGSTYLPETECHPAFGESGETATEDTGLCWWEYPLESVNINSCYDFGNWMSTGVFNFTLKSGARVFDIFSTTPEQGAQKKIFEM